MSWSRRVVILAACVVALDAAALAVPNRLGVEFQVNTYTTGYQYGSSVAVNSAGSFIVVWTSLVQDDGAPGVFGRHFNASGVAQAEFRVNSYTLGQQQRSAVAAGPGGDFVVVWDGSGDGSSYSVRAQRIDSAGVKQGAEFQVNSLTVGEQRDARVAAGGSGFVVVWRSQDGGGFGVFGRRFNGSGVAQGDDFQVNTYTVGTQSGASVAMDITGRFVVAWKSFAQDGQNYGVFGRRFDSSGSPLATEFQINTRTSGNSQYEPSVAIAADGSFVVAWKQYGVSSNDMYARRFTSSGGALATEFRINDGDTVEQFRAAIAMRSGGDFIVTWSSSSQDGDADGIFAREFTASGALMTTEFQVNTYTTGYQAGSAVGVDAAGNFVVAWDSPHDGSNYGVFAQRFRSAIAVASIDVDGNGVAEPLTDGLLLLRYLFGFRGATLTTGAVAGNCTRCTAPEIEAFIEGLTP